MSKNARGLGAKEREVVTALSALERPVVSAHDLVSRLAIDRTAANLLLSRLSRKGWLRRLRRGLYTVVPLSSSSDQISIEDPLATAMKLFEPCYISGWTAAEHWDLTEQVHNAVVVYSAKAQRSSTQAVAGVNYRIRRVDHSAFFGTVRLWSGTVSVEMADMNRTLIDILDAPAMGGGGRQMMDIVRAYWSKPNADAEALLGMAKRLGHGALFKRLGFTTERFGRPTESWQAACRDHLTAGVSLLDPGGPIRGPIISRWRLRINIPITDLE